MDVSKAPGEARGPLGDARPYATEDDAKTNGGLSAEAPEDRPSVGSVQPGDYPNKARDA